MPYTTHRPTARVLDIMQLLSTSKEGCSLTEIATAISVPKSTIVPIIRTLCERRFITQHGSNKYTVGISALIVGSACLQDMDILELFKAQMKRIVNATSEACQLGVLVGGDVLYLAKEESPEPIRLISFVGKRLPAYSTAIGKALLSEYTLQGLQTLYPQGLAPVTERTWTLTVSMMNASRARRLDISRIKKKFLPASIVSPFPWRITVIISLP